MANVAVIGGGISGLSCAYYLRKLGPDVVKKVALFEKQTTLGGWIQSTCFPDGTVYEHGPHTMRQSGIRGCNALAMIDDLALGSKILHVTSSHPPVKKRLILVNEKLHELPSSIAHLFRKKAPFEKALFWYLLRDLTTKNKVEEDDESLDSLVRRRFGDELADLVIDPMCRGITAGSSKEISARSLMPEVFQAAREYGSILRGMIKQRTNATKQNSNYSDSNLVSNAIKDRWAFWTFKNGLQQLPLTLEERLKSDDCVKIYSNIPCDRLELERNKATLRFEGDEIPTQFDHVFACIPAKQLSSIVNMHHPTIANHLLAIPSVHVAVINLEYRGKHNSQGFGYLVPSNQKSKLLGVLFDSCSFPQHDGKYSDKTRFTCMMGGKWFYEHFGDADKVDANDLLKIAVSEVGQQLKIRDEPFRHYVKIHKNCIAQYRVGHHKIMESIENEIRTKSMCVSLSGASYNGVGINDCIYNARMAVEKYLDTLRTQ